MHLTLAATGPATPDVVWERYTRPALWSQWSPQVRRVDGTADVLEDGSSGRVHGPPGLAVDFVVTALDADAHTWSWEVRVLLAGVRLGLEHGVQPHPDGVRTWLRLTGPAPVVLGYAPVARLALGRLVQETLTEVG